MKREMAFGQYKIEVFGAADGKDKPVIWLHTFAGEAEKIWKNSKQKYTLISVTGVDWNRELSPWPAEKTFPDGEDFGGEAEKYLDILTQEILPEVEAELPFVVTDRGIAGYSMAGLFSIYAMYHTGIFHRIGSMSGSLWFDGWKDYALSRAFVPENPCIYLSLGTREHRIKETRMAMVRETTENLFSAWKKHGKVLFENNPGGHFTDVTGRMARGIDALAAM